jgi:hypothetical protein
VADSIILFAIEIFQFSLTLKTLMFGETFIKKAKSSGGLPLILALHCKKWIFQKNVNMTSKDDEITYLLLQETFQLSYQF